MKKALSIILTILVWTLVVITVGIMIFTLFSVSTFDKADRSIFGYKFFIVTSDSMSATDFSAGDIIFVKNTDPSTLKVGDVISFTSQNSNNKGDTITHKIREITTDENGDTAFITYGTTTDTNDEIPVTYPYVLGKYTGKLSKVGSFFQFLKTTPGYITCIFIPFLLLVLYQGFNTIRLFRKYKKEQTQELEKERQKLEEERKQTMEMMKELQELRQQLEQKKDEQSKE